MTEVHTTFALARKARACPEAYRVVAKALGSVRTHGKNTPIPLTRILEIRGLSDTLWCLRCVLPEEEVARDRLARLLACDYAEHVLPIWEARYPEDRRPHQAIETARRYADGRATEEELTAAEEAAREAAEAAGAAWAAAGAAWSAGAAREAAWAAWAARAARAAAGEAAGEAAGAAAREARAAERDWQAQRLREALE